MFDNLQQAQKFCKENAIQMVDFMMIDLGWTLAPSHHPDGQIHGRSAGKRRGV